MPAGGDHITGRKTELKRITASVLTRERQLFHRKPLLYNAMRRAMVQA